MSSISTEGLGGKGGSQDFELNLAPIIDCLTVLIAFMLASATFLAIGLLDAGIAAAGKEATPSSPPPISITLKLEENKGMLIEVTGKMNKKISVSSHQQDWNFDDMTRNLQELKSKYPVTAGLVLNAANAVEYRDVIKTMEAVRKTLPDVLLGGF